MPPEGTETIEVNGATSTPEAPAAEGFDEIVRAPELEGLTAKTLEIEDAERQRMADEARADIAKMADMYQGAEGFKDLPNADLLRAHDDLGHAAERGNPTAVALQQRYAETLQKRGVDTISRRQPEAAPAAAPSVADQVERGGWRSFFKRG